MRAGRLVGRIAGAGAALAIPLLPKCPLCVLPLFAAAGIAVPHGPLVEALVVGAVAAWLGIVLATARWFPVRVGGLAAAAAVLGGRLTSVWWLNAAGGALMLAVGIWVVMRPRACHLTGLGPSTLSPRRGERAG